jgi:YD repeat-containing protein
MRRARGFALSNKRPDRWSYCFRQRRRAPRSLPGDYPHRLLQQKRVSLGYAADVNALSAAQKQELRQAYSMTYAYDPDGYVTRVTDASGLYTSYTYGGRSAGDAETAILKDNLLSITDRNGVGATTSDSDYFRSLRQDLGYVDLAGNGVRAADLSAADKLALLERFTTRFTYDTRGNLLTSTDGEGRVTAYAYTAFNKLDSVTSAMGHALATSNEAFYQAKRVELGFAAQAGDLSAAQQAALRELYTTRYTYDTRQNLVQRTDAGGDVTRFTYDSSGNVLTRTVFMDPADASRTQVTRYSYDAWGNNVLTVDGEGHSTARTFDSFGNLLTSIDGRGDTGPWTRPAAI